MYLSVGTDFAGTADVSWTGAGRAEDTRRTRARAIRIRIRIRYQIRIPCTYSIRVIRSGIRSAPVWL